VTASLPLDGGTQADADATITLSDAPAHLSEALARGAAVAWSEPLTIRTYDAGEPSAYPMYLDHRVYQGSSGRVYPLPFVEHVADVGVDRQWQAVHLENAYVRLVVLPELGGRIHIGYDKTTDYDFFYRNNVIKPALVGLEDRGSAVGSSSTGRSITGPPPTCPSRRSSSRVTTAR